MARKRTKSQQPHILVAIPYEPNRNPIWPRIAGDLANNMVRACPELSFDVQIVACPRTHEAGDGKFSANARARNQVIDTCLKAEHTHVLWIDSDMIRYPADLATRLLEIDTNAIVAPACTLDKHHQRFYDILGFVEDGRGFNMQQPWCTQPGPIVELDSVGCVYIAPAAIYRAGARYANVEGYTEHMAVMREAAAQGIRICADLSIEAVHAWLPDYGEQVH